MILNAKNPVSYVAFTSTILILFCFPAVNKVYFKQAVVPVSRVARFFLTVSREVSHMNIYVGNLSFDAGESDVRQLFEAFGQVSSVSIIEDKFTGRPRGFAFVEMATDTEAQAAIAALNGKDLKGRPLTVNEARPRTENRGGGGGFRGNKGGGGGGRRAW
jgi:cold-inducible RNA-binding protein